MNQASDLIFLFIVLLLFFIPLLRKLLLDAKRVEEKQKSVIPPPVTKKAQVKSNSALTPHMTKRVVNNDFAFRSHIEEKRELTHIDERALELTGASEFKDEVTSAAFTPVKKGSKKRVSVARFLATKSAREKMVIYSEIFKAYD